MEKKEKRYYKVGEKVWMKGLKRTGTITKLEINQEEKIYKAWVEYKEMKDDLPYQISHKVNLWEIDKLRKQQTPKETVYFSRIDENAIVPSKREEDAGYDFYACLHDLDEIVLDVGKPTLIPTGIATALPKHYYFNLKHERGSTGKLGMCVLAGVVDSGYRGEIFINICSLYKKVVISKHVNEVVEKNGVVYYPSSKAICQGTIDLVPKIQLKEIPFKDLGNIKSERGTQKLGASGK